MKVVVTGGSGFLGQRLIGALCGRGRLTGAGGRERAIERIVAVDRGACAEPVVDGRVGYALGDVADAAFIDRVLDVDTDSVLHLAAVVSGEAERDFDLGMRVNLDGTRGLLEACRRLKQPPKLVFASSVAVFGPPLPQVVADSTAPTPQASYGVQKLAGELLVGEFSRKGFVDGRCVRLPTIVVRPGRPNAAASSFASGIIREPLAGREAICPVDPSTGLWVSSPVTAVEALLHAHELPAAAWGALRSLNLPGLTVTVAQMVEALRQAAGEAVAARVRFEPDEAIARIVRSWPARFDTARARAMGFPQDADFASILREYMRR
ncbi:MAG: SDR family oxidoreductase [Burkholderiaceae bacterium]|jgi:nucleoside-diphosphate-sugar epimerase|nr:SDR family oxidoreductase [Burkholderiaceae bacterium]